MLFRHTYIMYTSTPAAKVWPFTLILVPRQSELLTPPTGQPNALTNITPSHANTQAQKFWPFEPNSPIPLPLMCVCVCLCLKSLYHILSALWNHSLSLLSYVCADIKSHSYKSVIQKCQTSLKQTKAVTDMIKVLPSPMAATVQHCMV